MQPIDLQKEAICFRWICHALQARRTSSQQAAGPVELTSNNCQLQATEKSFFSVPFWLGLLHLLSQCCTLCGRQLASCQTVESLKPTTTTSHIFEFVSPAPDSAPKTGCFWAEVIEVMVIAAKLIASTKEMTLALRISYWYRGRDIIHPINPETLDSAVAHIKKNFMIAYRLYDICLSLSILYLSHISMIPVHSFFWSILATAVPHLWIFGCSSSDPGSAGDRVTPVKLHGYLMSLMRFDRTVEVSEASIFLDH